MGVNILDQTVAMLVPILSLEGECQCPEPMCDPVAGCAIRK